MSLTSQLHHGVLSAWCADRFPGVEGLIDQVHAAARRRLPVRPIGEVSSDHWTQIDGAFRQRLAFFTSREPPYAALLGAARVGLPGDSMIDTVVGLHRVSSVRREFLEYAYALRAAEGAAPLTVGGNHGS
jgi:hypothetical protein